MKNWVFTVLFYLAFCVRIETFKLHKTQQAKRISGAKCIDLDCTWVEQWVDRAGLRENIYFKPEEVKAAIVTCGGLCPGLNDVIR